MSDTGSVTIFDTFCTYYTFNYCFAKALTQNLKLTNSFKA